MVDETERLILKDVELRRALRAHLRPRLTCGEQERSARDEDNSNPWPVGTGAANRRDHVNTLNLSATGSSTRTAQASSAGFPAGKRGKML
jgi:hypothetical protein